MTRLGVFSFLAVALVSTAWSGLAWSYDPRERDLVNNQMPEEFKGLGVTEQLGASVPLDLTFTDDRGNAVQLGQYFSGTKPVILSLVYYTCPSLCNIHLNGLMDGIDTLKFRPGKDFELVFVSFEPKDTVEIAAAKKESYVQEFDLESYRDGIHFLTGEQEATLALADAVGFSYKWDERSFQWAHASAAIFASPGGVITRYLHGVVFDERNLRLAVMEASEGKVGDIIDQIILFCFNYDPAGNEYAVAAFRVMRLGGAVMVGIVALWLVPFWWRRKRQVAAKGVK